MGSRIQNGKKDSHPVNFVELCSIYNRRDSIFGPKGNEGEAEKEVKRNSYFGLKCSCEGSAEKPTNGICVLHDRMMHDADLNAFLVTSSIDGQKGRIGEKYRDEPEAFFSDFYNECKLLNILE